MLFNLNKSHEDKEEVKEKEIKTFTQRPNPIEILRSAKR